LGRSVITVKQESIGSSLVIHCHGACSGWSVCMCFHYPCQQCAAWLAAARWQVRGQPSAVSRRTLSWPIGVCVHGYVTAAEPSVCVPGASFSSFQRAVHIEGD